ncbi:hypothetical protein LWE61_15125 [Sphingobium sufflavum]|nr:hypothetical protein [Sphingobium sufflavum]MCE7797881.1 hypothetical protein [Sphingobium sufflavum]
MSGTRERPAELLPVDTKGRAHWRKVHMDADRRQPINLPHPKGDRPSV